MMKIDFVSFPPHCLGGIELNLTQIIYDLWELMSDWFLMISWLEGQVRRLRPNSVNIFVEQLIVTSGPREKKHHSTELVINKTTAHSTLGYGSNTYSQHWSDH